MKTTIDFPDALYRKVKIRAVERGQSLKDLVVAAVERSLRESADSGRVEEAQAPYWAARRLLPEFRDSWEAREPSSGTDSTLIVSEDRDRQ